MPCCQHNNNNHLLVGLLLRYSLNIFLSDSRRSAEFGGKFAADRKNMAYACDVTRTINDIILTAEVMQHRTRLYR